MKAFIAILVFAILIVFVSAYLQNRKVIRHYDEVPTNVSHQTPPSYTPHPCYDSDGIEVECKG